MKYTYQDSTELPVQRDFIEDLKLFIDTTAKVIPLENAIIEMKYRNKETLRAINKKLEDLNFFEERFNSAVKKLANEIGTEDVNSCVDAVLATCRENIEKKREALEDEPKNIEKETAIEYHKLESRILENLNNFLVSGVYGAERRFEISMNEYALTGEMQGSASGLQYRYKLEFMDGILTMGNLLGTLSLPTWTRTGLLRREEKIKMLDISDFLVTSLEYDNQKNFRIGMENKKASRKFRIEGGGLKYFVYDDEKAITSDKELSRLIEMDKIAEIPKKIQNYLKTTVKLTTLTAVRLDEEDALSNNQVFDCLKVIAEQYGSILQACLEKSYNKEEIVIKLEELNGKRTEKYISKDEIYKRLAEIGSEGIEIAGILGVDTKNNIKNTNYLIV